MCLNACMRCYKHLSNSVSYRTPVNDGYKDGSECLQLPIQYLHPSVRCHTAILIICLPLTYSMIDIHTSTYHQLLTPTHYLQYIDINSLVPPPNTELLQIWLATPNSLWLHYHWLANLPSQVCLSCFLSRYPAGQVQTIPPSEKVTHSWEHPPLFTEQLPLSAYQQHANRKHQHNTTQV